MNNLQKWLLVLSAIITSGALAYYFLVYIPRAHQAIDESCKKILDASYSQLKQDDWMALKLAKEECVKKLIR